jgi:hypothetical protein
MRNLLMVAMFLILMAFFAVPAHAEPSITGPTGLIVNPTADVTPTDHVWIAVNFFDNDKNTIWNANVTGSISENFELGAGIVHPDAGNDGFNCFAKYLFSPETEQWPGGAVGVTVVNIDSYNAVTYYVVGSKFFTFGKEATENASLHAGASYVTGDGNDQLNFFGGFDAEVMDNLLAIIEYNSDDSSIFNGLTYGARYYFSPKLTGQAGFIDGDLHLGASYVF